MGYIGRLSAFLSEVRAEVKKVTFPSREEVVSTTIVVLVTSVVFSIFLWAADFVILRVYRGLFDLLGAS